MAATQVFLLVVSLVDDPRICNIVNGVNSCEKPVFAFHPQTTTAMSMLSVKSMAIILRHQTTEGRGSRDTCRASLVPVKVPGGFLRVPSEALAPFFLLQTCLSFRDFITCFRLVVQWEQLLTI